MSSFSSSALDALATMTLKFNDAQKGKAKVVLQNTDALTPQQRAQLPTAALFDLDESTHYFTTRPRFVPFHQLIKDTGEKISFSDFYPQITDAISDSSGRMQALPMGMAIPVLFRNKDYFVKAGLDPEKGPATWAQVQEVAGAIEGRAARIDGQRGARVAGDDEHRQLLDRLHRFPGVRLREEMHVGIPQFPRQPLPFG